MAWPIDDKVAQGQLALQLSARVLVALQDRGLISPDDARAILSSSVAEFPEEHRPQVAGLVQKLFPAG